MQRGSNAEADFLAGIALYSGTVSIMDYDYAAIAHDDARRVCTVEGGLRRDQGHCAVW